jgi:hypothetical protein
MLTAASRTYLRMFAKEELALMNETKAYIPISQDLLIKSVRVLNSVGTIPLEIRNL